MIHKVSPAVVASLLFRVDSGTGGAIRRNLPALYAVISGEQPRAGYRDSTPGTTAQMMTAYSNGCTMLPSRYHALGPIDRTLRTRNQSVCPLTERAACYTSEAISISHLEDTDTFALVKFTVLCKAASGASTSNPLHWTGKPRILSLVQEGLARVRAREKKFVQDYCR